MAQKHDTPEYVDAPMTRAGKLELAASRRQIRSDAFTAARWTAVNPILQLGEIGYETDTNKLKVGDGVTEWNSLGYVSGGGGGSVDYAKTVQRAETMPTADSSNAGQQFLYSGESDATYTHGYIYENVATTTSSSASAEQTVGSTLSDIAVDLAALESFTGWTTDNSLQIFYTADGWSVNATSLGVTYTGTPNVGDAITITYTAESATYAWTRVDVQPAGATYTAGSGISIDANNEISVTAPTLTNTATGANSLTIFGTASTGADTINIGRNSTTNNKTYAVAIGNNAQANDYNAVAIGRDTVATYAGSVAIGNGAKALNNGVSVGVGVEAGNYSSQAKCVTCIGAYARASASYAIEINASDATLINAEQGTLCIGLRHNNAGVNYKLLDSDGTIPEARLADTTNAQQGDVLTLDSTGNAVWQAGGGDAHNKGYFATLAELQEAHPTAEAGDYAIVGATDTVWIWDADNSAWVDSDQKGQVTSVNGQTGDVVLDLLPSQTGNAGKFLITNGTDASWSDKPLVNKATQSQSLSIMGANAQGDFAVNVGFSSQVYQYGSAFGRNSFANTGCVAIGYNAMTVSAGSNAVAIGASANCSAQGAIQISSAGANNTQTNSDANTFKVANANGNFELMNANGNLPADRLASTTGLADGNYRLRLVMASGVPTLEWVAE